MPIGLCILERVAFMLKTSSLSKQERLQLFAEIACRRPTMDEEFTCSDPSDPENKKNATKWLKSELNFLGKRDAEDLVQTWEYAINDGRYVRMLFSTIKILQEKYKD
jgi:hypothetical protein